MVPRLGLLPRGSKKSSCLLNSLFNLKAGFTPEIAERAPQVPVPSSFPPNFSPIDGITRLWIDTSRGGSVLDNWAWRDALSTTDPNP